MNYYPFETRRGKEYKKKLDINKHRFKINNDAKYIDWISLKKLKTKNQLYINKHRLKSMAMHIDRRHAEHTVHLYGCMLRVEI
jgi:hypothetical protein